MSKNSEPSKKKVSAQVEKSFHWKFSKDSKHEEVGSYSNNRPNKEIREDS